MWLRLISTIVNMLTSMLTYAWWTVTWLRRHIVQITFGIFWNWKFHAIIIRTALWEIQADALFEITHYVRSIPCTDFGTDWPGATIKYLTVTAFFCLDSKVDRKKKENNIFLLNVARFSETLYDKTWVVFPLVMTTNLYLDRGDIVYYLKVEHS